jgi:hypothetical protein
MGSQCVYLSFARTGIVVTFFRNCCEGEGECRLGLFCVCAQMESVLQISCVAPKELRSCHWILTSPEMNKLKNQ